jgi:hypothetical protein
MLHTYIRNYSAIIRFIYTMLRGKESYDEQ